jgi:predicted nucleic acid-binding protein
VIILESSVLIDYLNGKITPHTDWLDQNADATQMGLTDLILYEVLRGVREDKRLAAVQEELQQFSLWPTMTPGLEVRSAENYRRLRQRGITIRSTIDCLIATFCIESGHTLLHNDRDFDPFEQHLGLQVIHPEAV